MRSEDFYRVEFSLFPLKMIIFMLVVGPLYGIYVSYSQSKPLIGLVADEPLLINYGLYFLVVFIFLLRVKNVVKISIPVYSERKKKLIARRVVMLAVLGFLSVFLFSGIHTIFGTMARGEVRVNTGFLGPLYAFSLKYLLPVISISTSVVLYHQKMYRAAFFCYILLILCGFMTGGKAITIFILLSTACYFWPRISLFKKILGVALAALVIITSHLFFTDRDITLAESANYNLVRGTEVAAYGVLASWDYNHNYAGIDKLMSATRSVFGDQLTSRLFTSESSNQVSMEWDIAKLITYNYYPNYAKAKAGTTNLTRTVFSDFVLFLGDFWFIGFACFLLYVAFLFRMLYRFFNRGNIALGFTVFTYINMTIIPIINSGGIFLLISIPIVVYYSLLYSVLRYYIYR